MSDLSNNNTARILVVDDSKLMRKSAIKMLGDDFDVVVAEDGEEGWDKLLSDHLIQVVFTDLNMPKLDGYGFVERIRNSDDAGIQNIPIVVVTGAEDESAAKERVFDIGATDFIGKPFNSTEIKARASAHANYQRHKQALLKHIDKDELTGLLNPQGFVDQLDKDLSYALRHKEELAVIVVEVDDFKSLFIQVGKQGADAIIKHVAKLINHNIRKEDGVGRMGLSKFYLSLPASSAEGAKLLADRIASSISSFKATLKGKPLQFSASTVTCYIDKGFLANSDDIIARCEKALVNKQLAGIELSDSLLEKSCQPLSIDQLLRSVEEGRVSELDNDFDTLIKQMRPLLALLKPEQKQQLMNALSE